MSKKEPLRNIILRGNRGAPNECWLWTNKKTHDGYGQVKHEGRYVYVHRLAYETHVASIPQGMFINHRCGNRACFNPKHLELVTRKQNGEYRIGQQSNNTSGYRGVAYHKPSNKWRAQVKHNRTVIHIGLYDTAEEAALAAYQKRVELGFHEATVTVPAHCKNK